MKDRLHEALNKKGDRFITILLVCIALLILFIALFTNKMVLKEATAAWVLFP